MEILHQAYKLQHYAVMKRRFRAKEVRRTYFDIGFRKKKVL